MIRFTPVWPSLPLLLLAAAVIQACATPPTAANSYLADIERHAGRRVADQIADMPFLATPRQGADIPALISLSKIAATAPGQVQAILNAQQPSGITDRTSWRIAPQHRLRATNPDVADAALNPNLWHLSETYHRMPNGQTAALGILHPAELPREPNPKVPAKALQLGYQMTGRLPVSYQPVPIVIGADTGPLRQGYADDAHIAISNRHNPGTATADWILAHEIAHIWWRGNAGWIDEGMAELIASLTTASPQPTGTETPCFVPDLIRLNQTDLPPPHCDYRLGGALFHDLHRAAPADFAQRTARLYRQSRSQSLDTDHIRQAFQHPRYQHIISRHLPHHRHRNP